MNTSTIAIIGGGNIGTSLITGLIAHQFPPEKLWVTDLDKEKLAKLQKQFDINVTTDNQIAVKTANVIILAVKPQIIAAVSRQISKMKLVKKPLFISVAAGIREKSLSHWLGKNIAIVRCMPNTPVLIRAGATALYANRFVTSAQYTLAESILRAVGVVVWIKNEEEMDAITALSGSGPAYFFLVIEILQQVGEKLGLSSETARLLSLQTALGAARMALECNEPVTELRRKVTSPGGTTEAALQVFEQENIRTTFAKALQAACARSKELAMLFDQETE